MAESPYCVVSEQDFLDCLRRVAAGEDPDLVYAEWYAHTGGIPAKGDDE